MNTNTLTTITVPVLHIGISPYSNRYYTLDALEKMEESFRSRPPMTCLGELSIGFDDPIRMDIDLARVSHIVSNLFVDTATASLMATIEILKGTVRGEALLELLANDNVHFSCNSTGSVRENGEVDPDSVTFLHISAHRRDLNETTEL